MRESSSGSSSSWKRSESSKLIESSSANHRQNQKPPETFKLLSQRKLINIVISHSVASVCIYIIMIEGLGKGVKYSLFVANAIIFVSVMFDLSPANVRV